MTDRVDPEGHGEEAGREEDGVLDGVEAGAGEGGRVVALVVELVDVLVKESTLELRKGWILWTVKDAQRPDQGLVASWPSMGEEDDVEGSHGVPSGGSWTISKPGVGIIYQALFELFTKWVKGASARVVAAEILLLATPQQ